MSSKHLDKFFVIAEAAVNGFGSNYLNKKTIEAAANAGCDAIKFQHIVNSEVYAPGNYKYGNYKIDDVRNLRDQGKLSVKQLSHLVAFGRELNIKVFATAFGLDSLKEILDAGVNIIKIASADLQYEDLVNAAIETNKEIILSSAMISCLELARVINILNEKENKKISLLHCVGQYPHDINESQIGALRFIKENFKGKFGFSDHTLGNESAISAATLGATMFEKHFTLSKNLGGLDAKHSLEPNQMKSFVSALRKINVALNFKERQFTKEELLTSERALRGCYYKVDLKKGEKLDTSHIIGLRPNQGVAIKDKKKLISKVIKKDVKALTPIEMEDLIDQN
tara:strand:+ start:5384 stop:6403 length:1020 start_codon:yes stop_codon:yes gene_type:complete